MHQSIVTPHRRRVYGSFVATDCHCSNCRRATGSAFKPFAGIERTKLRITSGADKLMIFGDENGNDTRCKLCGSFLYSVVPDGEFVHMAWGASSMLRLFVGSKARWFTITDDLPQYADHVVMTHPTNE